MLIQVECTMKTKKNTKPLEQPETFTPGITKGMVRQHAYQMFRDLLPDQPLTLEDWVRAEKDLAATLQTDELSR